MSRAPFGNSDTEAARVTHERTVRILADALNEADPVAVDNLHADWARESVARTLLASIEFQQRDARQRSNALAAAARALSDMGGTHVPIEKAAAFLRDRAAMSFEVMWHISPTANRAAITAEGLRPDPNQPDHYPGYVWLFDSREDAEQFLDQSFGGSGGHNDLWAVDTRGYTVLPDPHPAWPHIDTWVYQGRIGPDRVRLAPSRTRHAPKGREDIA